MSHSSLPDLTAFVPMVPYATTLGFSSVVGDADRVVAVTSWDEQRTTIGGGINGGFLMAVADNIGALLAGLNLPEGAGTATIESKTNFLRAVTEGEITATSTPIHVGRTTIVVQTDITRNDGKLVSRTTQTQAVLGPS